MDLNDLYKLAGIQKNYITLTLIDIFHLPTSTSVNKVKF